jgi:CheY-like chemotaxis protein
LCYAPVDQTLIQTRKQILEQAGHTVIDARDGREVVAACAAHRFDVAVIGQAVSPRIKRHIAALIRQHCPGAKLLEMHEPHEGRAVPDADDWLESPPQNPGELPARVERLIAQVQLRKAKANILD